MQPKTVSSIKLEGVTFVSLHDTDGTAFYLKQAGMIEVYSPSDADLIVFNGGEDIATELYGERPVMARIPKIVSVRDQHERYVFEKFSAPAFKKMFLGICRGSQLLNVLNGGTLWQHVNNHGRTHVIWDVESGDAYMATSTHHQQMRPNLKTGDLVAVARESTEKMADGRTYKGQPADMGANFESYNGPDKAVSDALDTEIVWYPGTRTLCIQGHPEYVPGSEFANYCLQLIKDRLNVNQAA